MKISKQSRRNAKAYISVITNRSKMQELQKKADAADFSLGIHSAILYGMLEGNPVDVNTEKCFKLLDEANKYGITPNKF